MLIITIMIYDEGGFIDENKIIFNKANKKQAIFRNTNLFDN